MLSWSKQIVVIGSGFGGIAAAVRLAARGHQVTMLEQLGRPGGRAAVFRQDGFTFDGGPTVITAPWLFEELFQLAGKRLAETIDLVPLDPFYRIFFPDGSQFDYSGDSAAMARQVARLSDFPTDVEGYRAFVRQTKPIFAKGFTELADRPFLRLADMLRIAPDLVRLGSYRTVYGMVSRFVRDERLRQVLSFHPLLVGGNPFQTTSIYTLIHYLEREWGVWFARGGTGAIVSSLIDLFRELGGTLEFNARVAEISLHDRRASGVKLADGRSLPADAVVCNADIATATESLLPPRFHRGFFHRSPSRMRHSMSLVVIYFGTNRLYRGDDGPKLAHHSIILGPRYRELLQDIFSGRKLADDVSLYLHMPTLTDPTLAPPGCESFYVLAPVPHLGAAIDWERAARPFRDRLMQFLEDHYLPDLSRHLVTEAMVDPRFFRDELGSHLGAGFSIAPMLTQSAWFRPHNRSPAIPNLYFVGAGTHPGAGIPGVLVSAKIADDLIAAAG